MFSSQEARMAAYNESIKDPKAYWKKLAERAIDWFVPFREVCSGSFKKGDVAWFADGKLNVSYNCLDRHVRNNPDKIAIIHEANDPRGCLRHARLCPYRCPAQCHLRWILKGYYPRPCHGRRLQVPHLRRRGQAREKDHVAQKDSGRRARPSRELPKRLHVEAHRRRS